MYGIIGKLKVVVGVCIQLILDGQPVITRDIIVDIVVIVFTCGAIIHRGFIKYS